MRAPLDLTGHDFDEIRRHCVGYEGRSQRSLFVLDHTVDKVRGGAAVVCSSTTRAGRRGGLDLRITDRPLNPRCPYPAFRSAVLATCSTKATACQLYGEESGAFSQYARGAPRRLLPLVALSSSFSALTPLCATNALDQNNGMLHWTTFPSHLLHPAHISLQQASVHRSKPTSVS